MYTADAMSIEFNQSLHVTITRILVATIRLGMSSIRGIKAFCIGHRMYYVRPSNVSNNEF